MSASKDFNLLKAIHPVRYRLSRDQNGLNTLSTMEDILENRGTLKAIQRDAGQPFTSFIDHTLSLTKKHPDFFKVVSSILPTQVNITQSLGSSPVFRSILSHFMHGFMKSPVLWFDKELMQSLSNTDVSPKIPVGMARPPFGLCYLAFEDFDGQPTMFSREEQRTYVLEGAYLSWSHLGEANSVLDIVLMGKPINHPIDDMFFFVQLTSVADGVELSLAESFARGMSYGDHESFLPDEKDVIDNRYGNEMFEPVMAVIKCLCFLNWNEANLRSDGKLSEAIKGLDQIKNPSKLEKAKIIAFRNVNQITVRGKDYGVDVGPQGVGSSLLSKSVHWRRGHFRNTPFGPSRQDRRITWIKPTLVNREKLGESDQVPQAKQYVAKP